MAKAFQYILVGKVTGIAGVHYLNDYTPYTVYAIDANTVVAGDVSGLADGLTVVVYGGPLQGGKYVPAGPYSTENGKVVIPIASPPKIGSTYLLFLNDKRDIGLPGFMGPAFGRFQVTPNGLIKPNGYEARMPGAVEVSGVAALDVNAAFASADPEASLESLAHVPLADAIDRIRALVPGDQVPSPAAAPASPAPAQSPAASPTPASPQ